MTVACKKGKKEKGSRQFPTVLGIQDENHKKHIEIENFPYFFFSPPFNFWRQNSKNHLRPEAKSIENSDLIYGTVKVRLPRKVGKTTFSWEENGLYANFLLSYSTEIRVVGGLYGEITLWLGTGKKAYFLSTRS